MDYIEIAGYKSIQSERIELQPINLLIGANGSGKSNFISFFEFLNRLYNRNIKEYIALSGGENKILHKGQKITDTISFKAENHFNIVLYHTFNYMSLKVYCSMISKFFMTRYPNQSLSALMNRKKLFKTTIIRR